MIPKRVHYCWFGPNPLPEANQRYLDSWREILPDYEFKLWNEENFDISAYPYAQAAYQAGKYAFVADVCRIAALYHEGGIYLDTDVQMLKPFDPFLNEVCFAGFEDGFDPYRRETIYNAQAGILGSISGSIFMRDVLQSYADMVFDAAQPVSINAVFNRLYAQLGIVQNNRIQSIPNVLTVYPSDYFICKNYQTGKINLTENSVCIHHYDGSWTTPQPLSAQWKRQALLLLSSLLGADKSRRLVSRAKALIRGGKAKT